MNILEAQREAAAAGAEARILEYDDSQVLCDLHNETEDPLHCVQDFVNKHPKPTAIQEVTAPQQKKQTPVKIELSHEAPDFVPSVALNLPSQTPTVLPTHAKSPEVNVFPDLGTITGIEKQGVSEKIPVAYQKLGVSEEILAENQKQDINACASGPCVNGGSCTDEMIGYTCTCTTGYIGSNCQYGYVGYFGKKEGYGINGGGASIQKPSYNERPLKENENHKLSTTVITLNSTTTYSPEISSEMTLKVVRRNDSKEKHSSSLFSQQMNKSINVNTTFARKGFSGSNPFYSTDDEADISNNIYKQEFQKQNTENKLSSFDMIEPVNKTSQDTVDVQRGNEGTKSKSFSLFSPNVKDTLTMNTMSPTAVYSGSKELYSTGDEEFSGDIVYSGSKELYSTENEKFSGDIESSGLKRLNITVKEDYFEDMNMFDTTSGVSMSVAACSEAADTCHVNAKYVYFDKAAYCECIAPFYGNGIRCLKTGKRLILRGKVNGVLNNKFIENVDLLSYVYTTNGRIETHMRSTQNTVKTMMKILQPIGDIIGWMFAVPQGKKAKNGFMMTGGELNRTALLKYQSGETVLITQQFSTISSEFNVHTFIKGTVPDPVDSILFNDFMEQYKRVSRGVIKSFSTRKFERNWLRSNFTVDQTITFNECQHSPFRHNLNTMRHYATRNLVMNDRKNDVLRFSSTNQIYMNTCASDSCVNGGSCTDEMSGYRCTCKIPFYGVNCEMELEFSYLLAKSEGDGYDDRVLNLPAPVYDKIYWNTLKIYGNDPSSTTSDYPEMVLGKPINECASGLCEHGGSCTDNVNGYTCTCETGYRGFNCEYEEVPTQITENNSSSFEMTVAMNKTSQNTVDVQTGNESTKNETFSLFSPNVEDTVTINTMSPEEVQNQITENNPSSFEMTVELNKTSQNTVYSGSKELNSTKDEQFSGDFESSGSKKLNITVKEKYFEDIGMFVDEEGKREGTNASFSFSTFTEDTVTMVTMNTRSPTAENITAKTHATKKEPENGALQRRSVLMWIIGCCIMSVWSLSS
ncbi:uncharacterized protein LOC127726993 [Mytilus californianus]|uniref:uncharacterized protein LOC127726993 n=1 Tax=Mytilus californianus TaxID=6549 RepID=UPI002247C9BE|nr:uncharacterized protein LOC127726993 [Mytilus californianus]